MSPSSESDNEYWNDFESPLGKHDRTISATTSESELEVRGNSRKKPSKQQSFIQKLFSKFCVRKFGTF